jgi:hypothetical protein
VTQEHSTPIQVGDAAGLDEFIIHTDPTRDDLNRPPIHPWDGRAQQFVFKEAAACSPTSLSSTDGVAELGVPAHEAPRRAPEGGGTTGGTWLLHAIFDLAFEHIEAHRTRSAATRGGAGPGTLRTWDCMIESIHGQLGARPFQFNFDHQNLVGRHEALLRGDKLLREWLSAAQRAQYDRHAHFEVIGSSSKRRYRINVASAYNIELLDEAGEAEEAICFLPEGNLVDRDVMLAQKIALETDEEAALHVANRQWVGRRRTSGRLDRMIDGVFAYFRAYSTIGARRAPRGD